MRECAPLYRLFALAVVTSIAVSAAPALAAHGETASTEQADRGIALEFRAGAEIMPAQAIGGMREYSFFVKGAAYGARAEGLANLVGPLWIGLGFAYDVVDASNNGAYGKPPISGHFMHLPAIVELGFRVSDSGSRVLIGFEFGRAWGGFDSIQYPYTDEATARIAGAFGTLRAGYALWFAQRFYAIGLFGVRAGSLDQTNATSGENSGLFYRALVGQLAVGFQP